MAFAGSHFHARDDVKAVVLTLSICPQATLQHIMIGDGDHIQMPFALNKIEQLARGRQTVTVASMHMHIGASIIMGLSQGNPSAIPGKCFIPSA